MKPLMFSAGGGRGQLRGGFVALAQRAVIGASERLVGAGRLRLSGRNERTLIGIVG